MSWFSGWSAASCSRSAIVVLDADERTVRLLSARAGGGGVRVDGAVEADFPADLDVGRPEEVGRFVDALRAKAGIGAGPGVLGLGADQVSRHELTLPAAPEAELWPMALMQARREQHLDNMATDFALLSASGEPQARVLAASVHNDILARCRSLLSEAGCPAEAIALRPSAAVRAVSAAGIALPAGFAALVDVGRTHTEITLLEGGKILASRAAAAGYGYAGGAVDEPADAPADAAGPAGLWMENLARELQRTLLAYGGAGRAPGPVQVLLSVRSEHAGPLAEHLRSRGGPDVTVVDPIAAVQPSADAAAGLRTGNFTAAIGLAVQYLVDRRLPVDFEHPKLARAEQMGRDRVRLQRLAIAFAAVTAMLLPTPLWFVRKREVDSLRSARDGLATQEKQAKRDTEKYRAFRDIWADKQVRVTDQALARDVAEETKKQKELKDQLEELRLKKERRRLEEAPFRMADNERTAARKELDSFRSRAVAERRFDSAKALTEIYGAVEAVFHSGADGFPRQGRGLRGYIVEYRLEPRQFAPAAGAAGKASYPVVLKLRAESGRLAQDLVDELNAKGEAQNLREQAISAPKDRFKVEFEVGYRPSFAMAGPRTAPASKAEPSGTPSKTSKGGKGGRS
jgi:Tfp pilus assembly PilM family ATPase